MYVLGLEEIRKNDIAMAGGKAANLGEMIHAGFDVPSGFCITSEAYQAYIKENSFEQAIQDQADDLQLIMEQGTIPDALYKDIVRAYEAIGKGRVAVRSSATTEDLPDASFAGQQETFLNIYGLKELVNAIKRCFASLWGKHAISYRQQSGYDQQPIALAVVVQNMIESDVSGVMFTVNPIGNNHEQMMMNASYGLGESVVSGIVTPDTFVWDVKTNQVCSKVLGSKEITMIYGDHGVVQIKTPDQDKKSYCLLDSQISDLARVGKRIETYYGHAQDIEWAIKDDKIYILQSRAVTTLDRGKSDTETPVKKQNRRERMMMNNLIEHCPNTLYPLELEPIFDVMDGKTKGMLELGVRMKGNTLKLLEDGTMIFQVPSIGITSKILLLPRTISGYNEFAQNKRTTEESIRQLNEQLTMIEKTAYETLSTGKLLEQIEKLLEFARDIIWVRFRYNVFPNIIVNRSISKILKKAKVSFNEYDLLSGLQYKTWQMNQDLGLLAAKLNQEPELKEQISKLNQKTVSKEELFTLSSRFPRFHEALVYFLQHYGWKSTNTYQAFHSASWHEDVSSLVIFMKSYHADHTADDKKYAALIKRIHEQIPKNKIPDLLRNIEAIRAYHVNRETTLYMLEQCYGLARLRLKELVIRHQDIFSSYEDILFLTIPELYKFQEKDPGEIRSLIKQRKKSHIKNQMLWNSMEVQSVKTNSQNIIHGVSGNTGKVKGTVRIIHDVAEFDKLMEGDILVCKYTDPVWTPLFTIAKAVVSDSGGPLSHSAIVAREYDIPAVLACGDATKRLQDGQTVLVDGDAGCVQVID